MSLTKVVYYSPKTIERIKKLCNKQFSYIVPGYPSNEEIKLSDALDIPILLGNIQKHLQIQTKSGAKKLFQELEIPVSPGVTEIYDEKEMINSLALLIQSNSEIKKWIFKIDNETGGRGIAYLDLNKWKAMNQLIEQTININ